MEIPWIRRIILRLAPAARIGIRRQQLRLACCATAKAAPRVQRRLFTSLSSITFLLKVSVTINTLCKFEMISRTFLNCALLRKSERRHQCSAPKAGENLPQPPSPHKQWKSTRQFYFSFLLGCAFRARPGGADKKSLAPLSAVRARKAAMRLL